MVKSTQLWLICVNASLGGFMYGYNLGVFNPCQDNVAHALKWGESRELYISIATAATPLAALVGSLVGSHVASKKGRRTVLMISDIIGILGGALSIFPLTICFVIGRFVTGLAVGNFLSVPPLYISEISPPSMAGKLGCLSGIQVALGLIVSFAFGLLLPDEDLDSSMNHWWMFMFGFQICICGVQFISFLCCFKFETVYWLKAHFYISAANKVIKDLEMNDEFSLAQPFEEQTVEFGQKIKNLVCGRKYRRQMRLGIVYNSYSQLAGINVLSFYSTLLFEEMGVSDSTARLYTFIIGLSGLMSILLMIFLVKHFGRKTLTIQGSLIMIFSLAAIGALSYFKLPVWSILILIVVYRIGYNMSAGSIGIIYVSEILPDKGIVISNLFNWIFLIVIAFGGIYMTEVLSFMGTMETFAGICLLYMIYFCIDMIETKGLNRDEIQTRFSKYEF